MAIKCFLADDVLGQSCYVWAENWEEAEQICAAERFEIVGEYVSTQIWWDMPKFLEEL